jgi:type IV pilus assembly protein PilP
MRYLINLICIALLLWGCDSANEVQAKPQVVRKKIVAPQNRNLPALAPKSVRTAKKSVPDKPLNQTVVAKVDPNDTAAPKQPAATTPARTAAARQPEQRPAENSASGTVDQKKQAFSPKSDITEIKPAAEKVQQPDSEPTPAEAMSIASNKAASNKSTAQKILPDGTPAKYNPIGKIDPFEPLFKEEKTIAANTLKHKKRIPRTPLERIDLGQLKLVGIIMADSGNRALVEEASGKGYVIKEGTYIGTNGGKIVSIQKETVTVEEELEDVYGKLTIRKKELKLPKPPGEF